MPLHDKDFRGFGSDNQAGVHPEVLAALTAANGGHQVGYGADAYTERLADLVRAHFGAAATAYPVFTGTGANVVALQAMTERWESVVCAESAHVNVDECGAPERAGLKLLTVDAPLGKLTPELVDRRAWGFGDEHHSQPKVVSVTQSTEMGTVYTPAEIAAVAEQAHGRGMLVHLDGARLANAAASLGVPLRALTTDVGVDVVSFGGTKNGAMGAECVVVLDPDAVRGMRYLRKSSMQLASKMRFLSAQLVALLAEDLWLRNAAHANAMATRLAAAVAVIDGVRVTRPVQANAVFAIVPGEVTPRLQARFPFYVWDAAVGEVRWMTSWDTTEADVDAFAAAVRAELAR